ncbi:MAG TPA: hypothetical protein VJR27_02555 [Candidatus Saccharimonadales bacterium]|nr:hypothetical protein [Candidatus Saccharimonadales bacterium]
MFVPYEAIPVPEATDFSQARERIQEMCQAGLPAFTMRCAEIDFPIADNHITLRREFGNTLAEQGLKIGKFLPAFHSRFGYEDGGLHCDRSPTEHIVDELNFHFTFKGGLRAFFLTHRQIFWNSRHPNPCELYKISEQNLEHGLVNDALFLPQCYTVDVTAPQLVAFRLGGKDPLVHQFMSNHPRRDTNITIANRKMQRLDP